MILKFFLFYICIVVFAHGRRHQRECMTRFVKEVDKYNCEEEGRFNARGIECGFFVSVAALVGMAALFFK